MLDPSGQAFAYLYAREPKADADIARVPTADEARRIAVTVAILTDFLPRARVGKRTAGTTVASAG